MKEIRLISVRVDSNKHSGKPQMVEVAVYVHFPRELRVYRHSFYKESVCTMVLEELLHLHYWEIEYTFGTYIDTDVYVRIFHHDLQSRLKEISCLLDKVQPHDVEPTFIERTALRMIKLNKKYNRYKHDHI